MSRFSAFAIAIIICSGIVSGQESLVWKITPPDSKISSYILCTSELPGVEKYDIATPATTLMNSVNTVAFFNVPDEAEIKNTPELMKNADESTLKGFYKREDRIRFELMVADKLQGNVENYYTTKPLYILNLLRDKDQGSANNFQQSALLDIALKSAKPTLSLLTVRQIAGTMDEMDFQTQAEVLINYIDNANSFLENDAKLFNFYSQQNPTAYVTLFYSEQQAAYIETMIGSINDLLIKKMEPLATQQSTLFVLNIDLVGGDSGLLKKLKAGGYTVTSEPFNYKLLPVNQQGQNTAQQNITTETIYPDDFPSITLMPENGLNPDEIMVVNMKDIENRKVDYKAYSDPFGDMFDKAAADTMFLDYWFDLKGSDANFTVRVPVKVDWEESETPWSDGGTIRKYVYQANHAKSDLFYSVGYTVYPSTFNPTDKNNFFDQFIEQTEQQLNGDIIQQRIISTPSFTGREFTAVVSDSFFVRSEFFLQDNILYQLLVGGPGNNPYSEYAEAFFSSFKLSGNTMSSWYLFEQSGFKCYLPDSPSKSSKQYTLESGPMTVTTFTSDDYKDLVAYTITISAYPPGHKFGNENSFFEDLVAADERLYIGKAVSVEKVKKDGVNGRYVNMQLMNQKNYRFYIFFDGNTVYQFVAGGDPSVMGSMKVNHFFDSIHFGNGN